jgi:hypothetical protein
MEAPVILTMAILNRMQVIRLFINGYGERNQMYLNVLFVVVQKGLKLITWVENTRGILMIIFGYVAVATKIETVDLPFG